MRIELLLAASLFAGAANAQTMKLEGQLDDLTDKYVYLMTMNGQASVRDSFAVVNGKFSGEVKVEAEPEARRLMAGRIGVFVWVEKGTMTVSGSVKDFKLLKVDGPKTQHEYNEYRIQLDKITDDISKKYEGYNNRDTSAKGKQLRMEAMAEYATKQKALSIAFIQQHPASFQSLSLFDRLGTDANESMSLFNKLSTEIRTSSMGKDFLKKIEIESRSENGKPVYAFKREDMQGNEVSIAAFKGKYVLIDFWASWCKPCRAENPNVLAAYNSYKDKGFTVLGVSIDDDAEKWKKAVNDDGMPWTQVRDRKDAKSEILDYYGINAIPSQLLVDPNGIIIGKNLRGSALQKKLAEIFKDKS